MDDVAKAWREMFLTAMEHVPRGQKQKAADAAMSVAMAYCWPRKEPGKPRDVPSRKSL